MSNADFFHFVEIAAVVFQILVLYVTSKLRAEILELKAHIYEHFVTWRSMRDYYKRRKDDE